MANIRASSESLLNISYITLAILFLLSLIILIFFTEIVYIPLRKITHATEQYVWIFPFRNDRKTAMLFPDREQKLSGLQTVRFFVL